MAVSPFAKIHDDDLDHRLLNRLAFGVPSADRIPYVAGIGMPEQSTQPAFWDPFAAGCNQVSAGQAPASPRACQFHMIGNDPPMQIGRAAVGALGSDWPARWAAVNVVCVAHAASSVSLGERFGRQDLIQSQIQRSRALAERNTPFRIMYIMSRRLRRWWRSFAAAVTPRRRRCPAKWRLAHA